jgi:CBS domain containing-hemolysin-like protein
MRAPAALLLAASSGRVSGGAFVAIGVAIVVLLVLAGFFAMAETSLSRMSRVKATALAEEGRRGSKALSKIAHAPERYLNPVLLLVLICHTLLATLVGIVTGPLGIVGVLLGYVMELVVIFVLAESGPKTWAVQRTERAALLSAPVVVAIAGFLPVRLLTIGMIGLANVLFPGKGTPIGPSTSEEELLALAGVAEEEEVIEQEERELIHSIIEFGDTITREVMVARPDMVTVDARTSVGDALEVALLAGFSRVPVHTGSVDDVLGLLFLKDLVRADRDGKEALAIGEVPGLVRDAHVVPETKRVSELMREMQRDTFHMAVVVDEYGGVAGLVTLEDLIEELVGDIVDEYDVEEPNIASVGDGVWRVAGSTPVVELNDHLGFGVPEDDDWDTIGGYLFHRLGHVPKPGEHVDSDGVRFTVASMAGNRIEAVEVRSAVGADGEVSEARSPAG